MHFLGLNEKAAVAFTSFLKSICRANSPLK